MRLSPVGPELSLFLSLKAISALPGGLGPRLTLGGHTFPSRQSSLPLCKVTAPAATALHF